MNGVCDTLAVDALELCGVDVGTTGRQVSASADGGTAWPAAAMGVVASEAPLPGA